MSPCTDFWLVWNSFVTVVYEKFVFSRGLDRKVGVNLKENVLIDKRYKTIHEPVSVLPAEYARFKYT